MNTNLKDSEDNFPGLFVFSLRESGGKKTLKIEVETLSEKILFKT